MKKPLIQSLSGIEDINSSRLMLIVRSNKIPSGGNWNGDYHTQSCNR